MKPIPILLALILATSLAQTAAMAAPSKTAHEGYTLQQVSQLFGDLNVCLSTRGIMVRSKKKSVSMLCLSPYKEVVVFSDRTHKYHKMPVNEFRGPVYRALTAINAGLLSDTPTEKKAGTTYKDGRVNVYRSTAAFTQKQVLRFRLKEIPGRAPRNLICYTSDNIRLAPQALQATYNFYGLPLLPGFPLYAEYIDVGGDQNISLKTEKLVKETIDDAKLALPASYTSAAKVEDLYISDDTADEVNMMMGGH
ncbi:MAG: hypothetical protein JST01_21345 [Cyanobacteria bacterium SZAS TMP-1]|nr:hypothetical protein [Cyanobacteria bacterium SZAS TMP-1]